jgi:predicted amidophosphoribosyltransferase
MSLVACKRCQVQVPVSDTTFDANGDYLCRKCTDVLNLATQVQLAQEESLRKASTGHGYGVFGLIRRWLAERRAIKENAKLAAAMPNLDALPTLCTQCGQQAPRGRSLCERCQPASV